jgi:predicted phosphodiesterase
MKLGVLSDAHGHVGALDAALAALTRAGAERIVFLGDAVGYIPDPAAVERIRALGVEAIAGNHEAMMLSGDYPSERESVYRLQTTKAMLGDATMAFVRGLAPSACMTLDGVRCLFVHGSPNDPTFGYVYPDTDLSPFADVTADVVFMGNTHRPFVRAHGATRFVNVGSCGLPRDEDPRGSACMFDPAAGQADILRFGIAASSRAVLAGHSLHPSVAAVLERCAAVPD